MILLLLGKAAFCHSVQQLVPESTLLTDRRNPLVAHILPSYQELLCLFGHPLPPLRVAASGSSGYLLMPSQGHLFVWQCMKVQVVARARDGGPLG